MLSSKKESTYEKGEIMSLFHKDVELSEDVTNEAVALYERNVEKYKGKSITWCVRVTADELGIKKDSLCEILDKYYGSEEQPEE